MASRRRNLPRFYELTVFWKRPMIWVWLIGYFIVGFGALSLVLEVSGQQHALGYMFPVLGLFIGTLFADRVNKAVATLRQGEVRDTGSVP